MKELLSKVFKPKPTDFYQALGEQDGITKLVQKFYEIMETDPKASDCLNLHNLDQGKITDESKTKLIYFLSGWLGGPNLFVKTYGPPMMRKRHIHVKITQNESDQWLYCMDKALDITKLKKKDKQSMMNSFTALTMRIQNH